MGFEDSEVYKAIDELLWNKWDPIGVNEFDEARDEYCGYLSEVFRLKNNGARSELITNYLFAVETQTMGLEGDIERCREIAEKVVEI